MTREVFLLQARCLQPHLQQIRRELHRHPEAGFELNQTLEYVRKELEEIGLEPQHCGKAGLVVLLGGKKEGKTILLRADMDALPLQEEADVDFASENPGFMHGCGHDMHTAMLLGAARLLKTHEEELCGTVKLMFQPAEEIFQGAQDMINAGVLENPKVDAALMIHVTTGMAAPPGILLIPEGGISMASCEQYHIHVQGKGGHGSTPHVAIDPLTAAAHIHLALQEISSRELNPNQYGVFTTCCFQAGQTSNVIPDSADMWGTIRTADPTGAIGGKIKQRIEEIAKGVGAALRCAVEVEFYDHCPCMVIDGSFADTVAGFMTELVGKAARRMHVRGGGSEDFAFVSHHVPTASMFLTAGNSAEGYEFAQHHPKVKFDDSILWQGSAAYCWAALRYLQGENGKEQL